MRPGIDTTEYLASAAEDAEEVLTHGRSIVYVILAVLGTIPVVIDRHPLWWVVPAAMTAWGMTAFVGSAMLLSGRRLPRGQQYLAVLGDMGATATIQFTVAAVAGHDGVAFAFGAQMAIFAITIGACGLRLSRRVVWFAFTLASVLMAVFLSMYFIPARLLAFAFLFLAAFQAHLAVAVMRKAAERDALARFVSPRVVERILKDSRGLVLGGVSLDATIMFTDLRGFTTYAEAHPAAEVVGLLNRLHEVQVAAVFAEGGTVNKFTGDGLLAIFGAPEPLENDAAAAVRAAERIVRETARLAAEGLPIRIGVGLHRGTVIAGNVGSREHLEYTVIGDVVNIAARLESVTREHEVDIVVSSEVVDRAGAHDLFRPLGEANLKGRTQPVKIFARDVRAAGEAPIRSRS